LDLALAPAVFAGDSAGFDAASTVGTGADSEGGKIVGSVTTEGRTGATTGIAVGGRGRSKKMPPAKTTTPATAARA
jgi:hypothetical protein